MNTSAPASSFAPTRWTLILRARGETPEAQAALSDLCETYYRPVLRFLCGEGRDEEWARELTQEFFMRILKGGGFDGADPERGRFRSYLLGALKHFLADHRKHDRRLKRGGGATPESLEPSGNDDGESLELQVADSTCPSPESVFDRQWALAVLSQALSTLENEFRQAGKADQFRALKPWLMGESPGMLQAEAGRQLGVSEGAIKVMIHRLRKRFRDVVRAVILETVRDPSLVDDELRHLIAVLS